MGGIIPPNFFGGLTMETLSDILRKLQAPIPQYLLDKKPTFSKGKKTGDADYISWPNLADLLDERVGIGQWQWEIRDVNQVGNRLTLTGVLTIQGSDKNLTMMATGSEDIDCTGYGDPSSNSEAMAMRRCAAKFGLGRDLWRKGNKSQSTPKPRNIRQPRPIQQTEKGTITREQWLALRDKKQQAN